MTETRNLNGMQLLIAFTTGAVAGATVAYLTAPRSGKETRAALQHWAQDARNRASRLPHAVREAVGRGSQAGKEAFSESYRGDGDQSDA
jgi:gas vesicle protein